METRLLKKVWRLVLPILATVVIVACGASDKLSPEQQVKQTLSMLEQAAEDRSMSDFMKHVSDDYMDHQGHTKANVKKIMQLQFLRNQNIHILSTIDSIEISGDTAAAELSAAMASNASALEGGFGSLRADTHKFSVVLKSGGEDQPWLVESVSWHQGSR